MNLVGGMLYCEALLRREVKQSPVIIQSPPAEYCRSFTFIQRVGSSDTRLKRFEEWVTLLAIREIAIGIERTEKLGRVFRQ